MNHHWLLNFLILTLVPRMNTCAAFTSQPIRSHHHMFHYRLPDFQTIIVRPCVFKNNNCNVLFLIRGEDSGQTLSKNGRQPTLLFRRKYDNTDQDMDEEDSNQIQEKASKMSRTGNWVKRLVSSNKEEPGEEVETDEKTGIFGSMGTAIKRISSRKDQDSTEVSDDDTFSSAMSPFDSEVALANELKLQKTLDFTNGESIKIETALSSLNDSMMYIEKQLKSLQAMNKETGNGNLFQSYAKEEERRLNRMKRDLESLRKDLILDDKRRRAVLAANDKEKQEKNKNEKGQSNRGLTKKEISKNDDVPQKKAMMEASIQEIEEESTEKGSIGKNVSNIVDGMVSGTQSAITNVWKKTMKTDKKDEWITVCPKTRISPGEIFPTVAGGIDLLVIGSKDGTKIHCVANTCPHLGTPLETGLIVRKKCGAFNSPSNSLSTEDDTKPIVNDGFEDCVVCPLHQTAFSLDTGEVNGEWCPYPPILGKVMGTMKAKNKLPTFKMRTRGKNIEIKINSSIDLESKE